MDMEKLSERAKMYRDAIKQMDNFQESDKQAFSDRLQVEYGRYYENMRKNSMPEFLVKYEGMRDDLRYTRENLLNMRYYLPLVFVWMRDDEIIGELLDIADGKIIIT